MEEILKLEGLIAQAKIDGEKFFGKGVKKYGTPLRNTMQEIKNTAQNIRVLVSEIKNA